jgi:hypothetical protein
MTPSAAEEDPPEAKDDELFRRFKTCVHLVSRLEHTKSVGRRDMNKVDEAVLNTISLHHIPC